MADDLPWFKCNPAEWLQSCADMESDEFGFYARLILFMYQRGGFAPFDEGKLRHIWNCSRQKARKVRDALIDAGRIERVGDSLTQSRVKRELRIAKKIDEKLNENEPKTEQKPDKNAAKTDHVFPDKSLKTNEAAQQIQDTRYKIPPNPLSGGEVDRIWSACQQAYPGVGWRRTDPLEQKRVIAELLRDGQGGDALVSACRAYAKENSEKPHKFDNFVRKGVWQNYAPAKPEDEAELWRVRLASWVKRGAWSEKWGPDPNSPACKAPTDLIRQAQERAA